MFFIGAGLPKIFNSFYAIFHPSFSIFFLFLFFSFLFKRHHRDPALKILCHPNLQIASFFFSCNADFVEIFPDDVLRSFLLRTSSWWLSGHFHSMAGLIAWFVVLLSTITLPWHPLDWCCLHHSLTSSFHSILGSSVCLSEDLFRWFIPLFRAFSLQCGRFCKEA